MRQPTTEHKILNKWRSRPMTSRNNRWSLWEMGCKRGELSNCSRTSVQELQRFLSCAEEQKAGSACWPPWAEGTERPGRAMAKEPERRQLNREGSLGTPQGLPWASAACCSTKTHEEAPRGQKRTLEKTRRTSTTTNAELWKGFLHSPGNWTRHLWRNGRF